MGKQMRLIDANADIVEVVRCKDCVHKSCDNEWTDKDGKHHHFVQCVRHRFHLWHKPDDFCSYGERRCDNEVD